MEASEWTAWILIVTGLLLVVWDAYVAFFNDEKDDTISHVVYHAALKRPIVPFVLGVVMGHLFWPQ